VFTFIERGKLHEHWVITYGVDYVFANGRVPSKDLDKSDQPFECQVYYAHRTDTEDAIEYVGPLCKKTGVRCFYMKDKMQGIR
jgi:hypothetical protein